MDVGRSGSFCVAHSPLWAVGILVRQPRYPDAAADPARFEPHYTEIRNAEEVGNHILRRIHGWVKTHPMVGDVRGVGLMIGIEIVRDKQTKEEAHDERERIVELAFERGILFLGAGNSSIRIAPPLIVTAEQSDIALDVLEECISIVEKERK